MKLIEELQLTYPHQLCISVSAEECQSTWKNCQNYSSSKACWNAYLNQLTLKTLLEVWRDEDFELPEPPQIWLGESLAASLWEFINGSVVISQNRRIALIPSLTIDTETLSIPQEWVNIPSFAASYYVGIQVLPEDGVLRVWGFTTHSTLKQKGDYNALDGNYILNEEEVYEDMSALWVSLELCPEPIPEVATLPQLSATEAEQLLHDLRGLETSPRLDIPFAKWGALLANSNVRQRLYELRLDFTRETESNPQELVHLSQWMIKRATEGWLTLEALVANYPARMQSIRGDTSSSGFQSNPMTVTDLSQHIQNTLDRPGQEGICRDTIRVLGDMGGENPEAIALLADIARTAKDEETRWEAAFSLERLAPDHPAASVRRAKAIELEVQLSHRTLTIAVYLMPRVDNKVGVWIQVRSLDDLSQLPPGLSLTIMSESGKTKTAKANLDNGESSELLQIRFQGQPGTRFQTWVALNDVKVVEDNFLI